MSLLVNVCDLEALDDHGISALFVAAQYGQQDCLEILVNAGNPLFTSIKTHLSFVPFTPLTVWFSPEVPV